MCSSAQTNPIARHVPRRRSPAAGPTTSRLAIIALLCALTLAACEAATEGSGQVVRVFDGDSFVMRMRDATELEVRLFGIDAPERNQPWSRRSREALHRLVRGHRLHLEPVTTDPYGRTVAVVRRVSDGLDVNREMIRQGDAWVYRRYTDDAELIRLEEEARSAARGLWSLPNNERVPPWQWRRQNRRR
jgi:endonuclease YncB( thermonuclease family)